jgi:hypothetical protein
MVRTRKFGKHTYRFYRLVRDFNTARNIWRELHNIGYMARRVEVDIGRTADRPGLKSGLQNKVTND